MQVWCTLKFKTCVFPVQVWRALKFKTFVFFCPCAGLVHFEVQNLCFFVPVQVWRAFKFKTCVFLVPVQVWGGSSLAAFLFDMRLRNKEMNFLLQLAKPKSPNMAHFKLKRCLFCACGGLVWLMDAHGVLLKYILSHGTGIDVFVTFFWWISESVF